MKKPSLVNVLIPLYFIAVFINGSFAIYEIPSPVYKMTFLDTSPHGTATLNNNSFPLFSIFPASLREVQVDFIDPHNWTNPDSFRAAVLDGYVITHYNMTDFTFDTEIIDLPNKQGITFNTTLPNGATVLYSYGVNLLDDVPLTVPRPDNDGDCDYAYYFNKTCNCTDVHVMQKNSLELSMDIFNWPFVDLNENYTFSTLIMTMEVDGNFDLGQYITEEGLYKTIHYEVCDVGIFDLFLQDLHVDASFFTNAVLDGEPRPMENVFDPASIRVSPNGYIFPFQFLFENFSRSLQYDPDFSIILDSTNEDNESGSAVDKTTMIVLLSVLLPVAVIVAVSVIVVVVVVGVIKGKNRSKGRSAIAF